MKLPGGWGLTFLPSSPSPIGPGLLSVSVTARTNKPMQVGEPDACTTVGIMNRPVAIQLVTRVGWSMRTEDMTDSGTVQFRYL